MMQTHQLCGAPLATIYLRVALPIKDYVCG